MMAIEPIAAQAGNTSTLPQMHSTDGKRLQAISLIFGISMETANNDLRERELIEVLPANTIVNGFYKLVRISKTAVEKCFFPFLMKHPEINIADFTFSVITTDAIASFRYDRPNLFEHIIKIFLTKSYKRSQARECWAEGFWKGCEDLKCWWLCETEKIAYDSIYRINPNYPANISIEGKSCQELVEFFYKNKQKPSPESGLVLEVFYNSRLASSEYRDTKEIKRWSQHWNLSQVVVMSPTGSHPRMSS